MKTRAFPQDIARDGGAMQETPDNVRGVGSVPQSADRHDDDGVEHLAWHAISVAAEEADVEVVSEKRGQRDVPTAPEILDAAGEVGVGILLSEWTARDLARRGTCGGACRIR